MANVKNYRKQGGEEWVVGGKLKAESGGEVDIESGAALKIAGTTITSSAAELNKLDGADANVTASNLNTLTGSADTTLHTHNLANGASDVTASAAELNKLDGAGVNVTAANLDTLTGSGDTTLHTHNLANGATDVTASAAEINSLNDNITGLSALVTAGLGVKQSVEQADHATSPVEVVAADGERACLIAAVCTTDVAGSTKPTFNLGEADGAADKFIAAATLENATVGDIFISAGVLTSSKAMQCAVTEGADAGVAPAGAFDFLVLLLPTG